MATATLEHGWQSGLESAGADLRLRLSQVWAKLRGGLFAPRGALQKLMPRLHPHERAWLSGYREALARRYPGAVERLQIYGPKARSKKYVDGDVNVLLVVKDEAGHMKLPLRRVGYGLVEEKDAYWAVPSIMAFTRSEWESRKQQYGSPLSNYRESEAVDVL